MIPFVSEGENFRILNARIQSAIEQAAAMVHL